MLYFFLSLVSATFQTDFVNILQKTKMARLVSYKVRDENRYRTFGGEVECNSSENLTETNRIKLMFKTKSSSPSTPSPLPSASQIGKKKKLPIKSSKKSKKSTSSSQCATWRNYCCRSVRTICCFCCTRCKRKAADDDDDDDDIDAKFEQYKREMKLNSAASGGGGTSSHENKTNALHVPEITFSTDQIVSFHMNGGKKEVIEPTPSPTKSKRFRYRKYWNWNDSLRSNSDKFLETLEYDMDGESSLKRNQHRRTKGWLFYKTECVFCRRVLLRIGVASFDACKSSYFNLMTATVSACCPLNWISQRINFIRLSLVERMPHKCMMQSNSIVFTK